MIEIPSSDDLSFEKIREILTSFSTELQTTKASLLNSEKEMRFKIDEKPTLEETLKAFAQIPLPSQSMYVDLYAVDGILKGISTHLGQKLELLSQTNEAYEKAADRLFMKVHTAVEAVKKEFKGMKRKIRLSIDYTRRYIIKECQKNRLKKVFDCLKNRKDKKKFSKEKIKKKLRQIHQAPLLYGFFKWKNKTKSIIENEYRDTVKELSKTSAANELTLLDIQKTIKFLQREKASQIEVDELKDVASKTDVRILFEDLKNIIVSYTNNIKTVIFIQKYNTYFNSIWTDLDKFRTELSKKAEYKPINELHEKAHLLKSELIDLSREQELTSEEVLRTDRQAQIENSDFRMALLEKKLEGFDSRLTKFEEERSEDHSYSRVMQNVFSLSEKGSSPVISRVKYDEVKEETVGNLKTPAKAINENIKIRTAKRRGSQG